MGEESKPSRDVFISHSSKDKPWADAACAVLERHKIRCWIAPRDIVPGTEWGAAIIQGMDACRVMVLIFSGHANASAQVRREVERAISKGLAVLPVRVEDVHPEGAMEFALGNTHWLDAFTPPMARQMEALASSVATLLGDRGGIPSPDAPDPAASEAPEIPPASSTVPRRRRALWPAATVVVLLAAVVVAAGFLIARNRGDAKRAPDVAAGPAPPEARRPEVPAPAPATVIAAPSRDSSAPEPIDLLARIVQVTPGKTKGAAAWRTKGGALFASGGGPVVLTPQAPEEYRLEITAQRFGDEPSEFQVGLACGANRCSVILDGWGGTISGLSWIDGRTAEFNETRHNGRVFRKSEPIDVSIMVRRGRIRVSADGAPIARWAGDEGRLSIPGPRAHTRALVLIAPEGRFRIDKILLTPLTGPPSGP